MKVFIHYEGKNGPPFTFPIEIDENITVSILISHFVSAYNKQNARTPLVDAQITLRQASSKKPLKADRNNLLELLMEEDRDLFVEDAISETISPPPTPPTPPPTSAASTKEITTVTTAPRTQGRQLPSPAPASSSSVLPSHSSSGMATSTKAPVASTPRGSGDRSKKRSGVSLEIEQLRGMLKNKLYRTVREKANLLRKLESGKRDPDVFELLAECSYEMKEYEECRKFVRLTHEMAGTQVLKTSYLQSRALIGEQQLHEAIESLESTIALAKKLVSKGDANAGVILCDAMADHIDTLFLIGRHNEAAALLNDALVVPGMESNVNFLTTYGHIAISYGKTEEGSRAILKSIVVEQANKRARQLVIRLLQSESGMAEVKRQIVQTAQTPEAAAARSTAAPAIALFATFAKDVSDLQLAVDLYVLSLQMLEGNTANVLRSGPSYVLNLVHVYEALMDFDTAISYTIGFLSKHKYIRAGKNGFSAYELLDVISTDVEVDAADESLAWSTDGFPDGYVTSRVPMRTFSGERFDGSSLDFLALAFTLVKILYSQGKLNKIPSLFRLIEPTRLSSEVPLHETNIRNEAAYYCCIARVLGERFKSAERPLHDYSKPESISDARRIYVCGDSHVLPLSWAFVPNPGHDMEQIVLIPKIVTGVKQWHLRPESCFYPKANFFNAVKSIPDHSEVVVVIGEIDCREGLLKAVEKCDYDSIEEGINAVIAIFVKVLDDLVKIRGFKIFVHPVPPVLDPTRPIVKVFNDSFKSAVRAVKGLHWLDFVENVLNEDGSRLRDNFVLDGTHMHPNYISLLRFT